VRAEDWFLVVAGLVLVGAIIVFLGLAVHPMHYTWTTPPDQFCNVWDH
jgi:hypothetical protein